MKGEPYPLIDWYKGDTLIAENSENYIRQADGLFIKNVTEADDGTYKCSAVVMQTGVYKSRNIKVSVAFKAVFVKNTARNFSCRSKCKFLPKFYH